MNIKSLLLGSAAALVAVSGARAADVIVPMEEPVDYVRVCDVYGEGFFYIPGTETCLNVSGYVRFRYTVGSTDFGGDFDQVNAEGDDYSSFTRVRARLTFDAREETELGTLRAVARVQAQNTTGFNDGDAPYGMDQGFIQLGGLTMGYLDTLWTEGDGLLTETDFAFGDFQTNRVSYTFAAAGLAATVSVEDDGTGDFAPDVVAKLSYSGGFGGFYVMGAYDERYDAPGFVFDNRDSLGRDPIDGAGGFFPLAAGTGSEESFAVKGGVSLTDLIAPESELKFEGQYAFDPSVYVSRGLTGNDASTFGGPVFPVEYAVGAGYAQGFGKLGVAASGTYGELFDFTTTVGGTSVVSGGEFYALAGNVGYEITNNFDVLGEVTYTDIDLGAGSAAAFGTDSIESTAGLLSFVRSF